MAQLIVLETLSLPTLDFFDGLEGTTLETTTLKTVDLSYGLAEIDLYESPLRMVVNG